MAENVYLFKLIASIVSLICFAITGVFFYRKKRTYPRLMMVCGLIFIFSGTIMQLFSPTASVTYDHLGNILSEEGTRLSWYYGRLLYSLGLIVTAVGFAIETFKKTDIE